MLIYNIYNELAVYIYIKIYVFIRICTYIYVHVRIYTRDKHHQFLVVYRLCGLPQCAFYKIDPINPFYVHYIWTFSFPLTSAKIVV